jgi:transcriptional regulator with XRE-family HTH domain
MATVEVTRKVGKPTTDFDLAVSIGFRIVARRAVLGMKQQELAARLGLTSTSVSRWEKGLKSPTPSHVLSLCRALEWTPNDLFGWEVER